MLLARRDNSHFVRCVYEKVVRMIFEYKSETEIKGALLDDINKLCARGFAYDDFVITKSVGDSSVWDAGSEARVYSDSVVWRAERVEDPTTGAVKGSIGDYTVRLLPADEPARAEELLRRGARTEQDYYLALLPAQVQLAERLRRRGRRVDASERLEYVVTTNGGHNAKQGVKIEQVDYFREFSGVLEIDHLYYLKALSTPIDQMLNIFSKDKNFTQRQYKFRSQTRAKLLAQIREFRKPVMVFS